jgi:hypothetical protein
MGSDESPAGARTVVVAGRVVSNRRRIRPLNRRAVLAADAELLTAQLRLDAPGTPPPSLLAHLDQRAARDRDQLTRMRPALAAASINHDGPPLTSDAFAALLVAARARTVWHCPHVKRSQPLEVLGTVHLSLRTWACDRCRVVPVLPDGVVLVTNDHRCDLCDTPPVDNRFHPFVVIAAGLTFAGEAGSCCAARLGIEDAA